MQFNITGTNRHRNTDGNAENEQANESVETENKEHFLMLKIITIGGCAIFSLNLLINAIYYFSGSLDAPFNHAFKYKRAISKAIILDLSDKESILEPFEYAGIFYSLYEDDGKYFLVRQKSKERKDKLLAIYDSVPYSGLLDAIKERDDVNHILDNLSAAAYEEYPLPELLYKSVRFINDEKVGKRHDVDIEQMKEEYASYIYRQERQKENQLCRKKSNQYYSLLDTELSALSLDELQQLKKDVYAYYAYTNNPKFAIAIFDELEARGYTKTDMYLIALMSYLDLYRKKAQLNDMLQDKYGKGIVYTFKFSEMNQLYGETEEPSMVIFSHIDGESGVELWQENINGIKVDKNFIEVDLKDGEDIRLGKFETQDIEKICLLLKSAVSQVHNIEMLYYQLSQKSGGV